MIKNLRRYIAKLQTISKEMGSNVAAKSVSKTDVNEAPAAKETAKAAPAKKAPAAKKPAASTVTQPVLLDPMAEFEAAQNADKAGDFNTAAKRKRDAYNHLIELQRRSAADSNAARCSAQAVRRDVSFATRSGFGAMPA